MGININYISTNDGSNTLYSVKFKQHFHNIKDGALNESLYKHIIPALEHHKDTKQLNILDICFGLGYNTFSTLYYIKKNNLDIKVNIYSPEFDRELMDSLSNFKYPKEFKEFKQIIDEISKNLTYKSDNINIEIFNGDAREYIKKLSNIDIVYQDAFSSDVNKLLWTKEYFSDIYNILNKDSIITTYSIATPIRLAMYESGFNIYEYQSNYTNKGTLAFKIKQDEYKFVDMELKKQRNKQAKALSDFN